MLQSSRGLGGSMPGEDVLRSARALSKGLRETEVPKEIVDTVTNLDTFIKEQQIIQAKVSALCQTSMSLEESSEFSKIHHLIDHSPEGKGLLEKTAAALESINCALREMQVSVNMVWQKAQIAGLPLVAGSSVHLPIDRGSTTGAPKLTSYFEATMRRLEEQVSLQQRRLDELMSSLSSSQDPSAIAANLPEVIANLSHSIICLAAKISERHETISRLQLRSSQERSSDHDDFHSFSSLQRLGLQKSSTGPDVGINPFHLASGSNYAAPSQSRPGAGIPSLSRPTLGGGFETSTVPPLGGTSGNVSGTGFSSGLRLGNNISTPTPSIFGSGATPAFNPTATAVPQHVASSATRPWSSDTTNNRFSASFSPAVAGQLDLLGTGKRSRAL